MHKERHTWIAGLLDKLTLLLIGMKEVGILALPGLMLGVTNRFQEVKSCLIRDCESNVIKLEKILMHTLYIFGFTFPRVLIWEGFKYLLSLLPIDIQEYFTPSTFQAFQMIMSAVEQLSLAYLWDKVREYSHCLRSNDCENNNFPKHINKIKISACEGFREWSTSNSQQVSTCEILFNDSLLILLALTMVILAIISSSKVSEILNNTPKLLAPDPHNAGNDNDGSNENSKGHSRNRIVFKSKLANTDQINFSNQASSASDCGSCSTYNEYNSPFVKDVVKDDANCTSASCQHCAEDLGIDINKPKQIIDTKCPKCTHRLERNVPNPWILFYEKCKSCSRGDKNRNDDITRAERIAIRVIEDLYKHVNCKYCKEKLKEKLKELILKERKKGNKPTKACK